MAAGGGGFSTVMIEEDGEVCVKSGGSSVVDMRGPTSAVALVGAFVFVSLTSPSARPESSSLPWTLDPTGHLGPVWWAMLYVVTVPAKEAVNLLLLFVGEKILRLKRMDEGETKVRKLERLEVVDLSYLALNTLVEWIGINHVLAFLLYGPVQHRMRDFGVVNGPLAFLVVMLANDVLYYPFHVLAHKRSFYPYCHKQHHRQFVPFRGYADASNQHPFEQLSGFSIFLLSMQLASYLTGLHAGAAWVCFVAWAVLNICNHLAFDSKIHLPLPYPAYPHDHQMHHRFPQCNYSTLTTVCDRIFGSFRPYVALDAPPPPPEKKLLWYEKLSDPAAPKEDPVPAWITKGRPELIPSGWSWVGLLVSLIIAAVTIEMYHLGDIPNHHEWGHFVKTGIVLANASFVCIAIEKACDEEVKPKKKKERTYTLPRMSEAVPSGHTKQFIGGKMVFKPKLDSPMPAKPVKRE